MHLTRGQYEFARHMFADLANMPNLSDRQIHKQVRRLRAMQESDYLSDSEYELYRRLCRGRHNLRVELGDVGEVRPIPGYPGYTADSAGYIITPKGKQANIKDPFGLVYIVGAGDRSAARLMLETFVGPADGRYAKHYDGDKSNIALENLHW